MFLRETVFNVSSSLAMASGHAYVFSILETYPVPFGFAVTKEQRLSYVFSYAIYICTFPELLFAHCIYTRTANPKSSKTECPKRKKQTKIMLRLRNLYKHSVLGSLFLLGHWFLKNGKRWRKNPKQYSAFRPLTYSS